MDRIAAGSATDMRDLFGESASQLGMNPAIVEKDFWVCWILKHLFAEPAPKEQMVFKGGTSLSKVFGLIERFSEDIDLILDWRLLGYGTAEGSDPSAPTIINLLKLSLLGRIHFEISKFHVSIQFHGVYGIYTVEPILYKNGTSGTTPNSHRNGPFLR
jgi:hypothetical protein